MKYLRYVLMGIAALVLVVAGVAGYIAATFDPNAYKPQIIQLVKEKKQRTLKLDGDIKLAFWPSLGADLGRLSLSEFKSDKEFAAVESARVSLALMPLLSKQLVVNEVTIKGVRANIVRFKDGRMNIDDLLAKDEQKQEQFKFDIDHVAIENAALNFRDEAKGAEYALSGFNLKTGRIANGVPTKVEFVSEHKGQSTEAQPRCRPEDAAHIRPGQAAVCAGRPCAAGQRPGRGHRQPGGKSRGECHRQAEDRRVQRQQGVCRTDRRQRQGQFRRQARCAQSQFHGRQGERRQGDDDRQNHQPAGHDRRQPDAAGHRGHGPGFQVGRDDARSRHEAGRPDGEEQTVIAGFRQPVGAAGESAQARCPHQRKRSQSAGQEPERRACRQRERRCGQAERSGQSCGQDCRQQYQSETRRRRILPARNPFRYRHRPARHRPLYAATNRGRTEKAGTAVRPVGTEEPARQRHAAHRLAQGIRRQGHQRAARYQGERRPGGRESAGGESLSGHAQWRARHQCRAGDACVRGKAEPERHQHRPSAQRPRRQGPAWKAAATSR